MQKGVPEGFTVFHLQIVLLLKLCGEFPDDRSQFIQIDRFQKVVKAFETDRFLRIVKVCIICQKYSLHFIFIFADP